MSGRPDSVGSPLDGAPSASLPAEQCARCQCTIRGEAIMLAAATMAETLLHLVLCGTCYAMLRHAIDWELAGAGPGGHMEAHADQLEEIGELGDFPNGSPALGDVLRTD